MNTTPKNTARLTSIITGILITGFSITAGNLSALSGVGYTGIPRALQTINTSAATLIIVGLFAAVALVLNLAALMNNRTTTPLPLLALIGIAAALIPALVEVIRFGDFVLLGLMAILVVATQALPHAAAYLHQDLLNRRAHTAAPATN